MAAWIGPAISAASSLLGGVLGRGAADDASDFAARQLQFQNLAAKKGIQWRVKDAREAGIHPVYALGAQTFSPSPISISGADPLAEGVAQMGQSLGQAVTAGQSVQMTASQKVLEALQLERAGLENRLLEGQISALGKVGGSPSGQGDDAEPWIQTPFGKIRRDPARWSSAQKTEDEAGDFWSIFWSLLQHPDSVMRSAWPREKQYYDRPPISTNRTYRNLGGNRPFD